MCYVYNSILLFKYPHIQTQFRSLCTNCNHNKTCGLKNLHLKIPIFSIVAVNLNGGWISKRFYNNINCIEKHQ